MSVTEILMGRRPSRAEIATETPIFHALASAETPIFYALTTAHQTPRRPAPYDAGPFVRGGNPPADQATAIHRDTQTGPIPNVADTGLHGLAPATTPSSQFTMAPVDRPGTSRDSRTNPPSAKHPLPEQPRRTGRHRLLSCM
jgi:hypothetical protein